MSLEVTAPRRGSKLPNHCACCFSAGPDGTLQTDTPPMAWIAGARGGIPFPYCRECREHVTASQFGCFGCLMTIAVVLLLVSLLSLRSRWDVSLLGWIGSALTLACFAVYWRRRSHARARKMMKPQCAAMGTAVRTDSAVSCFIFENVEFARAYADFNKTESREESSSPS